MEYASEFRYRNPIVTDRTLCIVISQSGETADTLAAMREAQRRGARTLGIVNVVGSTIAREADAGIYLHAGPEIGVASTKAFTSQVVALALFTLKIGRLRDLSVVRGREIIDALQALPGADPADPRPRRRRSRSWPKSSSARRTSCTWAAATTSRPRSKGRSSSRRSATSTPRAIRPRR